MITRCRRKKLTTYKADYTDISWKNQDNFAKLAPLRVINR